MATIASIEKSSRLAADLEAGIENFLQRTLDICVSITGLILLSPLFLLLAVLIRHDSPGPIIYKGPRLGKNGRLFKIIKFRTMYERPESYAGPSLTGGNDRRVTPLGHWLRDTKLNELPQLLNVLAGDMSLVGPRPEDPGLAKAWSDDVREKMLSVRPGITSPASIVYKEEEKLLCSNNLMEDYFRNIVPSKLSLDLQYISNRSLLSDLDIIFLTVISLLPGLRKATIPEKLFYRGPFYAFFNLFLNWFVLDWIVAFIAVSITGVIWRLQGPINWGWLFALENALIIALVFSLTNLILGINKNAWRNAPAEASFELGISTAISTLILIVGNSVLHVNPFAIESQIIATSGGLAFMGFIALRYRDRLLTGFATRWLILRKQDQVLNEKTLIVGAGELGEFVASMIKNSEFSKVLSLIGFVDDDPKKLSLLKNGLPVLDSTAHLAKLIDQYEIRLAIIAINQLEESKRTQLLEICKARSVKVVVFPNIMEKLRSTFHEAAVPGTDSIKEHAQILSQMMADIDELLDRGDIEAAHQMVHFVREHHAQQPVSPQAP